MRHINILAIIGSTKDHSSNFKLVRFLKGLTVLSDLEENQKIIPTAKETTKAGQIKFSQDDHDPVHWDTFPISGLPFFDPDLDKLDSYATTHIPSAEKEDKLNKDFDNTFENKSDSGRMASRVPTVVQQLREKVAQADAVVICTPEYIFSLPGILKNALEWLVSTTVLSDKPMALITAAASGDRAKESLELIVKTLGGRFTEKTSIHIRGIAGKFDTEGRLKDPEVIALLNKLIISLKELILADQH